MSALNGPDGRKYGYPKDVFSNLVDRMGFLASLVSLGMTRDVSDAPFNPLADFLADKVKARTMSESADSFLGSALVAFEMLRVN